MRTLLRNKRPLYLCKSFKNENGIMEFQKPVSLKINYEPTNSSSQLFAFGQHYAENLQAIVDLEIGKQFKEGDRCYIFVKPPIKHDRLCKNADYIVNVLPQTSLNQVKLNFIRLSGTVNKNAKENKV